MTIRRARIVHDPQHPEDDPAIDVVVEVDDDEDGAPGETHVQLFQMAAYPHHREHAGLDHIALPAEHLLRIAQYVEEGATEGMIELDEGWRLP
jgi:hypothetical protein